VKPYRGISDLLLKLKEDNIKIGVITSSPKPYCEKIIQQNKWVIDALVGYHDTSNHKPHPDPILFGLKKIDVSIEHALSVGDMPKDIIASKKAGVMTVGVTWGCENIDDLIAAKPDKICNSVEELDAFIHTSFFDIK
jgi:phosphoglycolate phosphatase-like HAD superfamily hydrolase